MSISKRRGLGKGLNELLSATFGAVSSDAAVVLDPPPLPSSEPSSAGKLGDSLIEATDHSGGHSVSIIQGGILKDLAVELIKPGPFQPRNTIHREGIEQLAESIKQQGVIQPIVVRARADGEYEILAGERRWRASQLAGMKSIPALIKEVPDEVAMAISLIENIQREDLNPVEQAKALKRISDELHLTHLQVSEMVGKSRATVTNLLRLLSLNLDVQLLVEQGHLEMGHARALLGLRGSLQSQVAKTIQKRGLSVRETERIVTRLQEDDGKESVQRAIVAVDPDIRRLEQNLADKLGAPVTIRHGQKGKGMLLIRYSSTEELDGILSHIMEPVTE